MIARPRVWGVVFAVCILGVGGTAAGSTRSAALRGTVLAAPAAPVCLPRVPCLHPAPGVVLAFARAGVIRTRVTTGADGSYHVSLAPGTYRVRVMRPAGVRRLTPATVSVAAGESKRVTFYLDSGIR